MEVGVTEAREGEGLGQGHTRYEGLGLSLLGKAGQGAVRGTTSLLTPEHTLPGEVAALVQPQGMD